MGWKKGERLRKAGLGVSIDEEHRGLKNLDFFADHTIPVKDMRYNAGQTSTTMGPLYLRAALAVITCPQCSAKVKRSMRSHPKEWLLKLAGRKVLYCTDCDWKEIVKEGKWEWEAIAGALAAFFIVCFAAIRWIVF